MTLRIPATWLVLLALCLGSFGCSHYQLGTGGKLAFTTLYIEPVENKTLLPQARAIVTARIREAFLQDGRVILANSPEAADATLLVTIREFHREVASVQERDSGLARKFTLDLAVGCTLTDRRADRVLFADRIVRAERDAFSDGGQLQAEYQTVPLLAEALAKKVAHAVLDVW